ncbi:ABC transporter [Vibrio sp. HA2012]|uniref:ABC transporter ATP-binding protein n=1 Tax=Vibrio sp. HA2012 TaxID=1971595 RepID=UPI000C2BA489|nr:ABC transporter ATP-binding protein [Vibrio sp. HA2012]PJC87132.1 ABC transporter [Vibrio sp. HA2012]
MFTLNDVQMVRGGRQILSVSQLSIPTSDLTVVLGHNGSGKSTLVSLLSGQAVPDHGNILFHDKKLQTLNARELARSIAFLPQKLPASSGLTVRELVRLGRFPWRGALGRWRSDDEAIIDQSMEKTGIQCFANTFADELSGGERQRAWVAMLLAQQSPVLILDEPTSALDIHHQYQLMELLADLHQHHNRGIIVILHDLNLALRYATRIIALKQGQIVFNGSADQLADEQLLSGLYHTPIQLIDHPQLEKTYSGNNKVAIVCG